jgi:hypothetical protein
MQQASSTEQTRCLGKIVHVKNAKKTKAKLLFRKLRAFCATLKTQDTGEGLIHRTTGQETKRDAQKSACTFRVEW